MHGETMKNNEIFLINFCPLIKQSKQYENKM